MKEKDKLQFKFNTCTSTKRYKASERQGQYSDRLMNGTHSQRVITTFDNVCEKLEQKINQQNIKIESLQAKYNHDMLNKFDKLIDINIKIGKNLEKLVKRFQNIQKEPQIQLKQTKQKQKRTTLSFSNLLDVQRRKSLKNSSKNILAVQNKPHFQIPKISEITKRQSEQIMQDGWDKKTNKGIQSNQNLNFAKPILSGILQNFLIPPLEIKRNSQQASNFTDFFRNIVELEYSQQAVQKALNKLMGRFYNKTAQLYYKEYLSGKLNFDDMRIKFCSDIFNHAIQMCQTWIEYHLTNIPNGLDEIVQNQIQGKDFLRLFNKAAINSLQYLIHKYPPSRAKKIDTQLSQKIKQIKSYSVVKYDLLRNAGLQFGLGTGQKDFSVEIKRWLNTLIKQSKKQYPLFKQTMKDIFTNCQGSLDGTKQSNDIQYLIGIKLPQNTELYTDQQIQEPGLNIKSPQVLRVLIKWHQQLISYFTNAEQRIMQNKFGFKSSRHKAIPIRVPNSRLQVLTKKLKNIYETYVKPFTRQKQNEIGIIMESLISISIGGIQGYDFLDQRQATIVKLAQSLYQTFKSYMLFFLNNTMENLVRIRQEYEPLATQSTINLISFNVMDLLRCRFTGSKNQIYRIYNDILEKKDYFQVIRVKNKLNEPTRDILINLKLKNSFLICEVQLSLGSIQQQLNDHFCHYLYELERSRFGTLFQCASLIANLDPRMSYIKKHKDLGFKKNTLITLKMMNKIRVDRGLYCSCGHPQQKMKVTFSISPYCCIKCNSFIEPNRANFPFSRCNKCGICICTDCIATFAQDNPELVADIFKLSGQSGHHIPKLFGHRQSFQYHGEYSQRKAYQKLEVLLQKYDYVILYAVDKRKQSKIIYKHNGNSITEAFSTIRQIQDTTIQTYNNKTLFCLIPFVGTIKRKLIDLQGYVKFHISLQWAQLQQILLQKRITQVICVFSHKIKAVLILDVVECPQQIKKVKLQKKVDGKIAILNKLKGNYLEITSKYVQDIQFLKNIQHKLDITTLNLWENKITNIDILSQFKNLEQLYLAQNQITSIDSILQLTKIQLLGLGDNQIRGSLPKLNMPNLQFCLIPNNKITNINNITHSNIPNIAYLKMSSNPFDDLPQLNLDKIQAISLDNCKIKNLTNFSKSTLPSMVYIILSKNNINGQLPMLNFPQLIYINLNNNKITSLAKFVKSNLPKLTRIDLNDNLITESLYMLDFFELRQLNINNNKISIDQNSLLESPKLPHLTSIDLRNNNLKGKLPVLKLNMLKKLDLGNNGIQDISFLSQSNFDSLEQLLLDHNKIWKDLPVLHFKKLKKIDLSFNYIINVTSLSNWKTQNIQQINLNNNNIKCIIPKMQFYSLKQIDFSCNKIMTEQYTDHIHLTPLIQKVKLLDNPMGLRIHMKTKHGQNNPLFHIVEI